MHPLIGGELGGLERLEKVGWWEFDKQEGKGNINAWLWWWCGEGRVIFFENRVLVGSVVKSGNSEMKKPHPKMWFLIFGGESGIRTPDTRIMIPLL